MVNVKCIFLLTDHSNHHTQPLTHRETFSSLFCILSIVSVTSEKRLVEVKTERNLSLCEKKLMFLRVRKRNKIIFQE